MKQAIIASIVFASLSSGSASALDLTNEKYKQDLHALQSGISGAQESVRQADLKAYYAQQAANHAEQSANEARSRVESANTRLNGVESDVLKLQENTTSLQNKVTDSTNKIAGNSEKLIQLKGIFDKNTAVQFELKNRVTEVDGKVAGNTADIAETNNRLNRLDTITAQNAFDISEKKKIAERNKELLDGNSKAIGTNKNGIAANKKGIENNAASIVKSQKQSHDYTASQVAAEATARVNGDRQTLQSANSYTNQQFTQLDKRIGQVRDNANAGTASALAASQIPQVDMNGKFSLGAGVGGYKGESALALGGFAHLTDHSVAKFVVTTDSQNNFGFGAGATISW